MSDTIGIMNDAYFVSRTELVQWVNDLLHTSLSKVEECASGAIHCHILDALHPGRVKLKKVNFNAKFDYEFTTNYKVLQEAFRACGINKVIPIDRLVKARYQDNLEFLQWMYQYYQGHKSEAENYNPVARRQQVGVKAFALDAAGGKPALKRKPSAAAAPKNSSQVLATRRPAASTVPSAVPTTSAATPESSSSAGVTNLLRSRFGWKAKTTAAAVPSSSSSSSVTPETATAPAAPVMAQEAKAEVKKPEAPAAKTTETANVFDESQEKQLELEEYEEMLSKLMVDRDFYFSKITALEDAVVANTDQTASRILERLYEVPQINVDEVLDKAQVIPTTPRAVPVFVAPSKPPASSTQEEPETAGAPAAATPDDDPWALDFEAMRMAASKPSAIVAGTVRPTPAAAPLVKQSVVVEVDDEVSFDTVQKRPAPAAPVPAVAVAVAAPTIAPAPQTVVKQSVVVEVDDEVSFDTIQKRPAPVPVSSTSSSGVTTVVKESVVVEVDDEVSFDTIEKRTVHA